MPALIHIGKTAGSTISQLLRSNCQNIKEYHLKRNYKRNENYIIWIRNPISRFVSAFNYSKHLVTYNCNDKIQNEINFSNCLCPPLIKTKIRNKNKYVFDNEYDNLIIFFKSANDLAEGLSSDDPIIKEKAISLMNNKNQHIYKGIGWYLKNGKFVRNRNKKIIFVGKLETMTQDIKILGKILKKSFNKNLKARVNIYSSEESKYLSPLAINNIIEFYKDTDYAALIELRNNGWITQEILDSYYSYVL